MFSAEAIHKSKEVSVDLIQLIQAINADKRLTLKMRGLLLTIMANPEHAAISARIISEKVKDGKSTISIGVKKLEEMGYLTREQEKTPSHALFGDMRYYLQLPDKM